MTELLAPMCVVLVPSRLIRSVQKADIYAGVAVETGRA